MHHHPNTAFCEALSVPSKGKNQPRHDEKREKHRKTNQQGTHSGKKIRLGGGGGFRCKMLPTIPTPRHPSKNVRFCNLI